MADDNSKPPAEYIYKTVGDRTLKVEIDYPDDWKPTDKRPAIVFFSGGAWRYGGTGAFRGQSAYLAKRGMVGVRAEYRDRTKDQVKAPTCLKDAISAMRWVRKNTEKLGVDPNRIVSSGGSAGGYLAAAVSTTEDYHSPDDDLSVSPKPNAMILFNPVVDFVKLAAHEGVGLGEDKELAKRLSPLWNLTAGTPPTLILIGSKDGFLDQVKMFEEKGKELGVRVELEIYEGQPHAFFNFTPYTAKTVARADTFLRSLGYLADEPKAELPVGKDPSKRRKKKRRPRH